MKYLIVVVLLVLAACAPAEDTVEIGVLGPLSGPVAVFGERMQRGIELAAEEINAQGGIDGRRIRLIYEDTRAIDLAGTSSALQRLDTVEGVAAVIGPYAGGPSKLAGQYSSDHDLFVVSPGDNFGRDGEYKLNVRYALRDEATLLAQHALASGWKRVAIIYYDNEWGQGYRDAIRQELAQGEGSLVEAQSYSFNDFSDVRTQLLKIEQSAPDALVVIDATGGIVFNQVREAGLGMPLLTEWQVEQETTLEIAADSVEGAVYYYPLRSNAEFEKRFKEKYGRLPDLVSTNSYDAMMILAQALRACPQGESPCLLNASIHSDYAGRSGLGEFDRDEWKFEYTFVPKQVRNGTFAVIGESTGHS